MRHNINIFIHGSRAIRLFSKINITIKSESNAESQPRWPKETTACNGATETEPDARKMKSIEEHQEIPKGEAEVMPVGELRKRRTVCNLAAERRQKGKERTRVYGGSRRNSADACKVSRRAKLAWRKKPLQENWEPGKL
jgi:hypothetical protein